MEMIMAAVLGTIVFVFGWEFVLLDVPTKWIPSYALGEMARLTWDFFVRLGYEYARVCAILNFDRFFKTFARISEPLIILFCSWGGIFDGFYRYITSFKMSESTMLGGFLFVTCCVIAAVLSVPVLFFSCSGNDDGVSRYFAFFNSALESRYVIAATIVVVSSSVIFVLLSWDEMRGRLIKLRSHCRKTKKNAVGEEEKDENEDDDCSD
jgi:hypothetical protein